MLIGQPHNERKEMSIGEPSHKASNNNTVDGQNLEENNCSTNEHPAKIRYVQKYIDSKKNNTEVPFNERTEDIQVHSGPFEEITVFWSNMWGKSNHNFPGERESMTFKRTVAKVSPLPSKEQATKQEM